MIKYIFWVLLGSLGLAFLGFTIAFPAVANIAIHLQKLAGI